MHRVALLKGGINSENNVSLKTAEACSYALKELKYELIEIDIKDQFISKITDGKVRKCFNALHGSYGENGSIPGLLNCLKVPYTHSGVLASSIAINKKLTKEILSKIGISFPKPVKLNKSKYLSPVNYNQKFVIKPNSEGSSIGVKIIPKDNKENILSSFWDNSDDLIAEEYIHGQELTVGVLNGKSLCVTEIISEINTFYDYSSKYIKDGSKHIIPANIPDKIQKQALKWAEKSYKLLNCRGVIRADFRFDQTANKLFMLEINTHPGMTETSLIPEQAEHCGISFVNLIRIIMEGAQCD